MTATFKEWTKTRAGMADLINDPRATPRESGTGDSVRASHQHALRDHLLEFKYAPRTVAGLRAITGEIDQIALLGGAAAIADGQGGVYVWDTVAALDDGVNVINPTAGSTAAGWRLVDSQRAGATGNANTTMVPVGAWT